jgi:hypothetical protein
MFQETKMLKVKRLLSGRDIMDGTRDGELSILTKHPRNKPRAITADSVSTLTDHSISDQDFQ